MAGGVVIALPVVILFLIFRNQLVGGLTAGGVKG
jgi:ABC-type maltose transport system permease subunit